MNYRSAISYCDLNKNLHGITVGNGIYYNKLSGKDEATSSYPKLARYSITQISGGIEACNNSNTWSAMRNGDGNNYWYLRSNGGGWTMGYNSNMYAICIYDDSGVFKN